MREVTSDELHAQAVSRLGLDPDGADLSFSEALAGMIRRAAALVCPAAPRTIIRAVLGPLQGLVDNDGLRDRVAEMLEALVGHGDLLELEWDSGTGQPAPLLFSAPPSFVRRQSGALILLGIAPDTVSPLEDELREEVEYAGHVRMVPAGVSGELGDYLLQCGFVELTEEAWLRAPAPKGADDFVEEHRQLLEAAGRSGEVPGLSLLDPSRSVRFYRGRWVEAKNQTGDFVGRRPQAFGADRWCYARLESGAATKLVGLPVGKTRERACDQAWRLQAGIDAVRDSPQRYRVRTGPGESHIIDFFSPVPGWAQRRFACFGRPVEGSGALFSFAFPASEVAQEIEFIEDVLWLVELRE